MAIGLRGATSERHAVVNVRLWGEEQTWRGNSAMSVIGPKRNVRFKG